MKKDLNKMMAAELRTIAREKLMPGAWKATKAEMLAYLESIGYQNAPELTQEPEADKLLNKEEEPAERIQDNRWELIAKKQLCNAYEQTVGGCENALADGDMTREEFDKWICEEALDEVYHEAITTRYYEDACGGPAPSEMRFAGKEFCYKYLIKLFNRDGYKPQNASYGTSKTKSNSLSAESEKPTERNVGLKGYAAWVVDRETKELTIVSAEAESREAFYNSIKGKYRVRLITKPEKIEEECKQWEIRHARNLKLKQEKYSRDKIEAEKMKMNVAEYRKWLRESAKTGK